MPAWPGPRLPTISVSPRRENRDTNARCADVVGRAVWLHSLGTIAATCRLAGPDWVLNSDRAAWGQDAVSSLGSVQVVPLCEERYRWSPESSAPVAGPRAAPRGLGRNARSSWSAGPLGSPRYDGRRRPAAMRSPIEAERSARRSCPSVLASISQPMVRAPRSDGPWRADIALVWQPAGAPAKEARGAVRSHDVERKASSRTPARS